MPAKVPTPGLQEATTIAGLNKSFLHFIMALQIAIRNLLLLPCEWHGEIKNSTAN